MCRTDMTRGMTASLNADDVFSGMGEQPGSFERPQAVGRERHGGRDGQGRLKERLAVLIEYRG